MRAQTFNYEVYALQGLQRIDEAESVLDDYFQSFPTVQDSSLRAKMHWRRAHVAERTGNYARAQEHYARAARFAPALGLEDRAALYLAQAIAYILIGDRDRALALCERVVTVLRRPAETDLDLRYLLGRALIQIADVLIAPNTTARDADPAKVERAIAASEEAAQLLDGLGQRADRQRIFALAWLADALALSGQRDASFEIRYQAAAEAEAHGDRVVRIEMANMLGDALRERGDYDESLTTLQQGLDLALQHGQPLLSQRLLTSIGEAYEAKGLTDEAAAHYRRAIDKAEHNRSSLGTTRWAATAFAGWQGPHRRLAALHLAQGDPAQAFSLLEQTRARHLHDLRREGRDIMRMDDVERSRLDSLDAEIEQLRTALLETPDPVATLRDRLAVLEVERYGARDTSIYSPPRPSDVQRALEPHEVLLSYFLDDRRSHLFVVTPDTFRAVPLDVTTDDVDSLVFAVGALWRDAVVPSRTHAEFEVHPLHALYHALVAPVRSMLPADASLIVIPDGKLRQVPFAMLLEAPAGRFQYADAPFLVRRFPTTMEQAAALLTEPAGPDPEPEVDLLAMGRSEFSTLAVPHRASERTVLADLPVVEKEIEALRALVPNAHFALNEDASEAMLERIMGRARVLHLASHATVSEDDPLYSHIELWPDSGSHDGRLHLYEVVGQSLAADLVVLSGCSTARGEVLPGEGMQGLQYAFRSAGANASVATLWHVDDTASGWLMERFYTHLRRGLPKDRALQQAQLDYLDTARGLRASPFYWAAPVLYGDTAPITWQERAGFPPVGWLALGCALIALALALPRRVRSRS